MFTKSTLDSVKYGVYQRIPIGTNINLLKFFTLSPQATFQQYTNFQTVQEKYDTITKTQNTFIRRGVAAAFDQSYQVNLTTKVYGDYLFNSKILKQIRHQIIPTIGFVVHPNMESDKYGFYKPLQTGIILRTENTPNQFIMAITLVFKADYLVVHQVRQAVR